jgi:3-oxoacyl-[acyl-carrier-protein] synthase II
MKLYIRAATNISPQKTFDTDGFLSDPVEYTGNRLSCIEPDYKGYIDPKMIRRMSRIIKMGVVSGMACLKAADVLQPDAIVTGTAYGCLEDTGVFLTNMVEQNEESIAPTAFVHSTHNTIGAQIALLLQCKQYNNTFVSGGSSFENALLDAALLVMENAAQNVLVGGIDEITNVSHKILSRLGLYKREPISNLQLFNSNTKGTIPGEGSAFFLIASEPSANDVAQLDAIATFYKPNNIADTEEHIQTLLTAHDIDLAGIDLLIIGNNGDTKNDAVYSQLQQSVFKNIPSVNYKHLCGEYPTSSAFALWLASSILKTESIPAILNYQPKGKINRILIYNHYQNIHHSLIAVSAC